MNHKGVPEASFYPSEKQILALNKCFDIFNEQLFEAVLPSCKVYISRKKKTFGYYTPPKNTSFNGIGKGGHKIYLTKFAFRSSAEELLSFLVHQMVHFWQWEFGKPSRNGYHNKEWASKMEEIGLAPTNSQNEKDLIVSSEVCQQVIKGGAFELALANLPPDLYETVDILVHQFSNYKGDVNLTT